MNQFKLVISVLGVAIVVLALWLVGSPSRYLRTAAVPPAATGVPVPEAKVIRVNDTPPDERAVAAEILGLPADQIMSWPGPKGTFWARISEVAGTQAPIGQRVYFVGKN